MVLLQKAHLLAPLDLSIPLMQLHSLQAQGKGPEMHAIVQKIGGLLDKMDTTKVTVVFTMCHVLSPCKQDARVWHGCWRRVLQCEKAVSYNVRKPGNSPRCKSRLSPSPVGAGTYFQCLRVILMALIEMLTMSCKGPPTIR